MQISSQQHDDGLCWVPHACQHWGFYQVWSSSWHLCLFQRRIATCTRLQRPRRSFYWRPAATGTCQTLQQKWQSQFLPKALQTERTKVFMAAVIRQHPWPQTERSVEAGLEKLIQEEKLWICLFLLEVFVIGDRHVNKLTKAFKQWWKGTFSDANGWFFTRGGVVMGAWGLLQLSFALGLLLFFLCRPMCVLSYIAI